MSDDLANNWGTNLCLSGLESRKKGSRKLPFARHQEVSTTSQSLPIMVHSSTDGKFIFERLSVCGSDANHWAVSDATNLNTSLCLFACGSYVAGDGSAFQCLSTSDFGVGDCLAFITHPDKVENSVARAQTIALPYHVPGTMESRELTAYEDLCLQALHIRLCWAKMRAKPYKALFLELMLAGNGAILSNHALIAIAKLAVHHQLSVIVDEIMTAGRTGRMFYLLSKPQPFISVVTHITLGKWTQNGIVVIGKSWAKKRKDVYALPKRGASTHLCEDEARDTFGCVKQHLHHTTQRREKILQSLKLSEKHVWGAGCLIYGPVSRSVTRGLKCRYLGQIHFHLPIDKVPSTVVHHPPHLYKFEVNKVIVKTVTMWALDVPQPEVIDNPSPEEKKMDVERLSDYDFISKLIKQSTELDEKTSEEWRNELMPKEINRTQAESAMSRLEKAGYMERTQKGKKRTRNWKLTNGFIAPWKN